MRFILNTRLSEADLGHSADGSAVGGDGDAMVTLVVFHHVADYEVWKSVFDEHENVRRAHGQLEHRVFRSVDNPNRVVVHNDYAAVPDG